MAASGPVAPTWPTGRRVNLICRSNFPTEGHALRVADATIARRAARAVQYDASARLLASARVHQGVGRWRSPRLEAARGGACAAGGDGRRLLRRPRQTGRQRQRTWRRHGRARAGAPNATAVDPHRLPAASRGRAGGVELGRDVERQGIGGPRNAADRIVGVSRRGDRVDRVVGCPPLLGHGRLALGDVCDVFQGGRGARLSRLY